MTPEQRKHLALSASMEGAAAVVAGIGKRVKVSQMELICLVTFAEIGLMSLFSELDGQVGQDAAEELNRTLDSVRQHFGKGTTDGLTRLSTSTAAMLRGEKFRKYLPR